MRNIFSIIFFILGITNKVYTQKVDLDNNNCCAYPIDAVVISPPTYQNIDYASSFGCKIKLWNLIEYKLLELKGHTDYVSSLDFHPAGLYLASGSLDRTVKIWNLILKKEQYTLFGHKAKVNQVAFSNDGNSLVSCGKDGKIIIYNANSGKTIHTLEEDNISVNTIIFSDDDQLLISGHEDGRITIWNTSNFESIGTFSDFEIPVTSLVILPPNFHSIIIGYEDGSIRLFDTETRTFRLNYLGHKKAINALALIWNENDYYLVSSSRDEKIIIWDVNQARILSSHISEGGELLSIASNREKKIFLAGGQNKELNFWSTDSLSYIAKGKVLQDSSFAIQTPGQYFLASKNAYQYLNFTSLNSTFPKRIIEVKYNRPDKVLQRLHYLKEIVGVFERAYHKRIEKLGYSPSYIHVKENYEWPEIYLTENLSTTYNVKSIIINIKALTHEAPLDRIVVQVNSNRSSIDLKSLKSFNYSGEIAIDLSNGKNTLEIYAIDQAGIESKIIKSNIFYTGDYAPENTYILSIGISDYEDSWLNLKYPAKDAKDILETLVEGNKGEVYQQLITNGDAKRILEQSTAFLKNCTINDKIIVFYSGDGLVDDQLNYYLATQSTNFAHPDDQNSIPYEVLENLINNLPARNKLLLLDASFYGEIDKEAIDLIKSKPTLDAKVQFRSMNKTHDFRQQKFRKFILNNSFELMRDYFPKIQSGTTIINSSSGLGFAFEDDKWKNGVFTYALIRGLRTFRADIDGDFQISTKELGNYLNETVSKLTDGNQLSGFRMIGNDFSIFSKEKEDIVNNQPLMIVVASPKINPKGNFWNKQRIKIEGKISSKNINEFRINNDPIQEIDSLGYFKHWYWLERGENTIRLMATDVYGNTTTESFKINAEYSEYDDLGEHHALIIGVSDYIYNDHNIPDLKYPVNDANRLITTLKKHYILEDSNLIFLQNPTEEKIITAFGELRNKVKEQDNVFIFFAGHGEYDESEQQGYLLPRDAKSPNLKTNWISFSTIKDKIRAIDARHILLVLDACYSGRFSQNRNISHNTDDPVQEIIKKKSRRVITSGSKDVVPDQSVFITYFLNFLSTNSHNFLLSEEIYSGIYQDVIIKSPIKQTPLREVFDPMNHEGGDFFLRKKTETNN